MTDYVVLLRAVNVGGRKMPMANLRALCERLGLDNPQTYIQSGNLLIGSDMAAGDIAAKLAAAIEKEFGFFAPIIIRKAAQWPGYIDANPFAGDAYDEKRLHLLLSPTTPPESAIAELEERAKGGERVRIAGDALWIDYASGVGDSALLPKIIDKAVGAPATARNLRTVLKLQSMLGDRA